MKAYLIDTPNKQVIETEWDGDWRSIKSLIQVDIYTTLRIGAEGETLYIDDEGLINGNPHGWFRHEAYEQPLRGYGLVLGADADGGSIEPTTSIDDLRSQITFYNDDELKDPEEYARIEVTSFNDSVSFLAHMGIKI